MQSAKLSRSNENPILKTPLMNATRVGTLAVLGLLVSCGGESTKPVPTEFSLILNPVALSIQQNDQGLVNTTVTITSGPGSDFTFSVSGVPTGVTVTVPPNVVRAASLGSATQTLGIVVAATAALGTSTITVSAKSGAGVEKTATFALTILPPPSFTLAVTPTAQSVSQGGTGGAVITLTRTNYTAPVQLLLEDNPPGVTGTFSPAAVTGTSSALTIVVDATTNQGTYPIVVRARGSGLVDRTATFSLTVTAAPTFTLTPKDRSVGITVGSSATDSIFITRTNYTQGIAFSLDSPEPGITGSFNPGATSGASTVLTLAVAPTVAPGNYTVTVRGVGAVIGEKTATITVTVSLPPPAYTLTVAPTTLSVESGQSGTAAITLGRTNFTGAVALALVNPPAGVTGLFAPSSVTGNTSQLTVGVAAGTAPGNYALTVRGTAQSLTDRDATLTLMVTAPPSSLSLTVSPESLFVFQRAQATGTVSIARANFASGVTLGSTGAPAGMTVSFTPASTTGNSATVTVAADSSVAAGRYVITLTASGTGVSAATKTMAVNVTAAGLGSIQFSFCDPTRVPVFFAVQDSTGSWTAVTPAVAGSTRRYYFDIVSNRGGVAFITKRSVGTPRVASTALVRRNRLLQVDALAQRADAVRRTTARTDFARVASNLATDVYDTYVYYLAKSEMNTLGQDVCTSIVDTKSNLAVVTGVSAGQSAVLSLGGVTQSFIGGTTTSPITFSGVPNRPVDLVGSRYSSFNGFERGLILRNLNVANGLTVSPNANFDGPNSFVPAIGQGTITNTAGHDLLLNSLFFTANGEAGVFGVDGVPTPAATRLWAGVPNGNLASGDLHALFALATGPSAGPNDFRSTLQYTATVGNATIPLGGEMDLIAVLPVGVFGDPRYRVSSLTLPIGLRNAVDVSIGQSAATSNSYRMLATGAFLTNSGVANGFDLTMPPLAALTGFPTASRLTAGSNSLRASALGWTGTGITGPRPVAGDRLQTASRGTTVLVP